MFKHLLLLGILLNTSLLFAQSNAPKKSWYEQISIRGYAQIRYNRLFETNAQLKNEQGDRSWGENGGVFMRRMRIIFSGQLNERVYFYVQPDFASSVSSSLHIAQLRDAYMDIGLDAKNEFRFRVGQSKVPFGFENMQSSQNRLPMDRSDGINSALSNERDLGVFFYWAPANIRKLFASLVNDGLKASGDYGVFGLGAFNGQTANRAEQNNEPHLVARLSYPFSVLNNQIVEVGVQGYSGNYVITTDQITTGVKVNANKTYRDERVAASFVLYPRPFGIQAEYNWGHGPEFCKISDSIQLKSLHGGYLMASYLTRFNNHVLIPFSRYHYYQGGKKHELDARSYTVNEFEAGVEWQPSKNFELVAMYTISSRRFEDYKLQNNRQDGQLLRLQAQLNF